MYGCSTETITILLIGCVCVCLVAQSCPTPSDPMDCSLPGSSVHGIFQARVLEWGAVAFSKITCIGPNISLVDAP